jgi:hypothetical protein
VGGVRTNAIPPSTLFGSAGLDAPTTTTVSMPNGVGGRAEAELTFFPGFTATPNPLGVTAPTDGFRSALLEQLNVTQGSAAGDIIALVQMDVSNTQGEALNVTGAPFIPGVSSTPGTVTLLQQDLAGASSDFIFMGSANVQSSSQSSFAAIGGFITATNYVVTQGNAAGDILSVLAVSATSPTTALSSSFVQGNGGDDAFFQFDNANTGGLFNYAGGSGGNYVQADFNFVIGTFDGGSNVAFNVLGQNNFNQSVLFVDFGSVIVA